MWNKFHFVSFSFKEIKIMKSYIKIILCLVFMMALTGRVFAFTLTTEEKNWIVNPHNLYWMGEPYYKFYNYEVGQGYVMVCDGFCCYDIELEHFNYKY